MIHAAFKLVLFVLLALALGCGDFDDCKIGELTGTWRINYKHLNGNCGRMADETVIMGSSSGSTKCTIHHKKISADRCTLETSFTCPTTDAMGSSRWVIITKHVDHDRMEGTGTVQVTHSQLGSCRSTYDMVWEQL